MPDPKEQKRIDRQMKLMTLERDRRTARRMHKYELAQALSDQIEQLQNEREE